MENRRLPYLEVVEEDKEIRYIGYALPLTAGEFEVLKAVFYADGAIDKATIAERVSGDVKMSQASIPVHAVAINKKAVALGGRKILGYKRNCGYFIKNII